ncbi:MAG: D-alanyl-D-alanine carboxypeptidase, partial [Bacteroidaceae bacterium]|nr:D-alanyl-D-alanine carboxypeptidase [Bacteroidaceae bacterium]
RAKTGTLTGVISLAGYAETANKHTLAFVIINQNTLQPRQARAWQDKVCEAICLTGSQD